MDRPHLATDKYSRPLFSGKPNASFRKYKADLFFFVCFFFKYTDLLFHLKLDELLHYSASIIIIAERRLTTKVYLLRFLYAEQKKKGEVIDEKKKKPSRQEDFLSSIIQREGNTFRY